MKKLLLIILLSVVVQSCDPIRYCRFYVVNKCNENIIVNVTYLDGVNKKDTVKHNGQCSYVMIHHQPLREEHVLRIEFDTIIVERNSVYSHVNYMDNNVWEFEELDKFNWKATIIINDEHFEN